MALSRFMDDLHIELIRGQNMAPVDLFDPNWVREIRDQCIAANVAFFFKQWGGLRPKSGGRTLDDPEWSDFPKRSGYFEAAE